MSKYIFSGKHQIESEDGSEIIKGDGYSGTVHQVAEPRRLVSPNTYNLFPTFYPLIPTTYPLFPTTYYLPPIPYSILH